MLIGHAIWRGVVFDGGRSRAAAPNENGKVVPGTVTTQCWRGEVTGREIASKAMCHRIRVANTTGQVMDTYHA